MLISRAGRAVLTHTAHNFQRDCAERTERFEEFPSNRVSAQILGRGCVSIAWRELTQPPFFDWMVLEAMLSTTKKINGVHCPRHAFAFAPSSDPKTWALPVWIPGDAQKSLNALKSSLFHFNNAKIPDCEKQRAFDTLRGAALAHGIAVEERAKSEAPAKAAEPPPPPPLPEVKTKPLEKDQAIAEAVALADFRAGEILRALGLD